MLGKGHMDIKLKTTDRLHSKERGVLQLNWGWLAAPLCGQLQEGHRDALSAIWEPQRVVEVPDGLVQHGNAITCISDFHTKNDDGMNGDSERAEEELGTKWDTILCWVVDWY